MKLHFPRALCLVAGALLLTAFDQVHFPDTTRFTVDVKSSTIHWRGYYVFSFDEHYGTINISRGGIDADGETITGGFFDIDMNTIDNIDMSEESGDNDVSHLKSEDFFSIQQFATAKFQITKAQKIVDAQPGQPNYEITGTLLIKDVADRITFPAMVTFEGNSITASARFKLTARNGTSATTQGGFSMVSETPPSLTPSVLKST